MGWRRRCRQCLHIVHTHITYPTKYLHHSYHHSSKTKSFNIFNQHRTVAILAQDRQGGSLTADDPMDADCALDALDALDAESFTADTAADCALDALDEQCFESEMDADRALDALDALSDLPLPADVIDDGVDAALAGVSDNIVEYHSEPGADSDAAGIVALQQKLEFGDPLFEAEYESRTQAYVVTEELGDSQILREAGYFFEHEASVNSNVAAGGTVGVDRRRVPAKRHMAAAIAIEHERRMWASLEEQVVSGCAESEEADAFLYLTVGSYDGVDLNLQVETEAVDVNSLGILDKDASMVEEEECVAWDLAANLETQAGKTKVLQSEYSHVMVFFANSRCNIIIADQLQPLQTSDRTTGEAMVGMLREHSFGIPQHPGFERDVRAVCTDRYAPNLIAERELSEESGHSTCHIECHAHILAAGLTAVKRIARPLINGMKSFVFAFRCPGEFWKVQSSYRIALWKKLDVVDANSPLARAPADAHAWKLFVLDAFLPLDGDPDNGRLRDMLLLAGPVDWRSDRFVFAVRFGESKERVYKFSLEFFLQPLIAHKPYKYPDGKWTGAEKTFKDVGVLGNVCNMSNAAYLEYMVRYHEKEIPKRSLAVVRAKCAEHRMLAIEDLLLPEAEPPTTTDNSLDWPTFNRNNRARGHAWLRSHPMVQLALFAMLVQCLQSTMDAELKAAALAFTAQQWSTEIPPNYDGIKSLLATRDWPLLNAATGARDLEFKTRLDHMHDENRYTSFPRCALTMSIRHFAFRVLSRQGSYFHEFIGLLHQTFPYVLFKLVVDASALSVIKDTCAKMRDSFSDSFVSHYAEGEDFTPLVSFRPLLELTIILIMCRTNTCRIESLNALLRRMIGVRYQTHCMKLLDLSNKFVLCRGRLRVSEKLKLGMRHASAIKPVAKKKAYSNKKKRKKTIREGHAIGGGAWRAYTRKQCKGVSRRCFKELWARFKSLDPLEKLEYERLGAAGKLCHRYGSSFGLTTRAMARLIWKQGIDLRLSNMSKMVSGNLHQDVATATRMLRTNIADAHVLRKVRKDIHRQQQECLTQWSVGRDAIHRRDAIATSFPALCQHAPRIDALPAGTSHLCIGAWSSTNSDALARLYESLRSERWKDLRCDLLQRHRRRHHPIKHENEKPIPGKPPLKMPTCRDARVCMCGPKGRAIWRLKVAFNKALTAMLKMQRANAKWLLDQGYVVCRITGFVAAPLGGLEICFDDILHIGFMYFQPWRPTFRLMTYSHMGPQGTLVLNATHTYYGLYEYFKLAQDKSPLSVQCKLYLILECERPIIVLDPKVVEVELIHPHEGISWDTAPSTRDREDDGLDDCLTESNSEESNADGSDVGEGGSVDEHEAWVLAGLDHFDDEIRIPGCGEGGGDTASSEHPSDLFAPSSESGGEGVPSNRSSVSSDHGGGGLGAEGAAEFWGFGAEGPGGAASASSDDGKDGKDRSVSSGSSSRSCSAHGDPPGGAGGVEPVVGPALEFPAMVEAGLRGLATVTFPTPYGVIRIYTRDPDKPHAIATTPGNISRQKALYVSESLSRYGQGQPFGFFYFWLQEAVTLSEQDLRDLRCGTILNFSDRQAKRKEFLCLPGAVDLCKRWECHRGRDIAVEPDEVP